MRASSQFILVTILLVGGCGKATTPPACAGSRPPASCFADLAPPPRADLALPSAPADLARSPTSSPDLTPPSTGLVISGDAASGYAGATITSFVCTTVGGGGPYIKIAPFPDVFSSSNPVHGVTPLELDISSGAIDLFGGNGPNLYYSTRGGVSFPTGNKSGTIDNIILQPQPGYPGTLTVDGTWQCP